MDRRVWKYSCNAKIDNCHVNIEAIVVSTFNVHGSPTEFLPCSHLALFKNVFSFPGFCVKLKDRNMRCKLLKKFWENGEIWSNKIISPSSISLIADLQRLFIDISNCYDSPGGNKFSVKSNGNWCAVSTHPVLELLKYMHTQTFQIKTHSVILPHFPRVYYGAA